MDTGVRLSTTNQLEKGTEKNMTTVRKLIRRNPVEVRANFINARVKAGASYGQAVREYDEQKKRSRF
jgi:lipopolysaccharide biosynthesis regulator YciM